MLESLGCTSHGSRPDGLVSLLRILGSRSVDIGLGRKVFGAELLGDQTPRLGLRLLGDVHAVRTHVGNQTLCAILPDLDTFIQFLSDAHSPLRRHSQPLRSVLLQGTGSKRGVGPAPAFAMLDVGYFVRRTLKLGYDGLRIRPVLQIRLGTSDTHQPRQEAGPGSLVADGHLRARSASTDQYSTGTNAEISRSRSTTKRKATDCTRPADSRLLHAIPEQRADLIAHQPVEDSARLLRIHQPHIHVAAVSKGLRNRIAGDLVEHDPPRPVGRDFGSFQQVPRNRFTFAIRVSRQVDFTSPVRRFLQIFDQVFLVVGTRYVGAKSFSKSTDSLDRKRSRTCPTDASHVIT